MSDKNSVRLNKYISESGICSRRQADKFIENGNVFINGKKAKIGDQVLPKDKVVVNGNLIEPKAEEDMLILAFNKPAGITSTTEAGVKSNIVDYINHSERIFPIGRLDKDSQGLIFLTNNGDIVNKILRAGNKHEKEYLVTVDKPITDQFITSMASGVPILGVMTKKCTVKKESTFVFKIILIQGLNRQIRRMCEHFGYEVIKLERTRIMNITLKGLPSGDWRELSDEEQASIFKLIKNSSSESEKAVKEAPADLPQAKKNNNIDNRRGRNSHTANPSNQPGASRQAKSSGKSASKPDTRNRTSSKAGFSKSKPKPKGGQSGRR